MKTPPIDLREIDQLDVFDGEDFTGTLTRTRDGVSFRYDHTYRTREQARHGIGVAISLPPRNEEYAFQGTNLPAFFAGLLPEGLRLKALRQVVKTSEDDLFSMLAGIGSNCAGNISVRFKRQSLEVTTIDLPRPDDISFEELFEKSIYSSNWAQRDLDSAVAGIMPKLSAAMISFPVSATKRGGEYLLKLASKEHPRLVHNEHFFMTMARQCGIRVPVTKIVHDRDGKEALLVERFDREYDSKTKTVVKLHQEDACQFLNRYPQDKYRVSMREICEGLKEFTTSPLIEIRAVIELYVFSYLIGNGDLHAKNMSILQGPSRTTIELSPAYDLLSTLPYGDRKMALRLQGRDDEFTLKDFVAFGDLFDVPEKAVTSLVKRVIKRTGPWMGRLSESMLPDRKCRDIAHTYEKRVAKLV